MTLYLKILFLLNEGQVNTHSITHFILIASLCRLVLKPVSWLHIAAGNYFISKVTDNTSAVKH